LKVAATSTTMKAANRILIAKMQTVKLLQREDRIVQEAIGLMAEIAEGVVVGIVGEVLAVAGGREAGAIVVLVAVEIAAIAKTAISKIAISL
jgi:hypothetical protein